MEGHLLLNKTYFKEYLAYDITKVFMTVTGVGLFMAGICLGSSALATQAQTLQARRSERATSQQATSLPIPPPAQGQSVMGDSTSVSETIDPTGNIQMTDTVGMDESHESNHEHRKHEGGVNDAVDAAALAA